MTYQRSTPYPDTEKTELARRNLLLTTELDKAKVTLVAKEERFEQFRKHVVEVAVKYAKENDWCEQVYDALDELGLKELVPSLKRDVYITFRVPVQGELGWDDDEYYESARDDVDYATDVTDWRVTKGK